MIKNLPSIYKTRVHFLSWEDPLKKEWQPTPVFLPGESPWTEEPGGLQSMGSQRARHNWATHTHTHMYLTISPVTREILYLFFKGFFFFFNVDHFRLSNLLQHCFCFVFWFFGFEAWGILAPWPGIEPLSAASKGKVLTTGLSGKSWRAIL